MGTTAEKINYAINATNDIAEGINNIGGNITQNTELADFRDELDKLYREMPKINQDGTSVTLANTRRGKIEITPKGNTYQQSYEGTQLIGFDDISETTINGITYSIKDNVFTLNGTATDNVRYIYNNHWKLKSAGNYNLKIEPISGTWTAGIMGLSLRRANNTQSTYHQLAYDTTNLNATKSYTDTQIEETASIGFYINTNSVFSNYKFRIIYNEGSTAKDYEPYVGGTPSPNPDYPQKVKVVTGENVVKTSGKNLFMNLDTETKNGITLTRNANGTYSLTGTTTTTTEFVIYGEVLPNGIYTLSCNKRIANCKVIVQDYNNYTWKKNILYLSWINNTNLTDTKTISSYTGNRTRYLLEVNAGTYDEFDIKIQLEQTSTATDYEPYIEPIEKELNLGNIELAKIGDYSDLIFKNEKINPYYDNTLVENAWYKKEIIGKAILTGAASESWGTSNNIRYTSAITDYSLRNNKPYSNYFIGETNKTNTGDAFLENSISFNNSDAYDRMYIKASSIEDIRVWLQAHNLTVYYIKRAFTDIQITDTTLINQLEELNKVIGQGGTVVIETESEEENAQLIVNASALASFENE